MSSTISTNETIGTAMQVLNASIKYICPYFDNYNLIPLTNQHNFKKSSFIQFMSEDSMILLKGVSFIQNRHCGPILLYST